jgi:hypothetical protein
LDPGERDSAFAALDQTVPDYQFSIIEAVLKERVSDDSEHGGRKQN